MRQDFTKTLKATIYGEILSRVHTCVPGRVVNYDAATGLATIEPLGYTIYNGEKVPFPVLYSVPVIFPRWGAIEFSGAVRAADEVLVVFAERGLDLWKGKDLFPKNEAYSLQNAIAFPGCFFGGTASGVQAQEDNSLIIKNDAVQVEILPGKIKITGDIEIDGTVTYTNAET